MKKRVVAVLSAMLLIVAGLVAGGAPKAAAASQCNTTGTLGGAYITNIGGSNSYINVWSAAGTKHSVYVGHPQYFCPAYVWVTAGRTVYVLCNKSTPIYWFQRRRLDPFHAKRKLPTYCAGFHSSTFKIQELKN